jgi:hypothetical protein
VAPLLPLVTLKLSNFSEAYGFKITLWPVVLDKEEYMKNGARRKEFNPNALIELNVASIESS